MPSTLQLITGVCFAATIAIVAYRLGLLSPSGAFAAIVVGACAFGVGGWRAAAPLLTFFATSNLLARYKRKVKHNREVEKSGPRDAQQVLANGGIAAVAIVAEALWPDHARICNVAFVAALAEANADTWATEIGSASRGPARLITTLRPVPPGRSGGVTVPGTLAALAGSAVVALSALPLLGTDASRSLVAVTLCGFAGSLIDSFLGATLQARYSSVDDHYAESPRIGFTLAGGLAWVRNDMVNLIGTLSASLFAIAALR
ncbi:MAG TPA: DUF92 domain-containing protein [Capsulimonadaceae bacterium]|jgi:uncharacterized protein (TIGR00297 family)